MNEEPPPAATPESREMIMENLGIVRATADVYYYLQYRYSKAGRLEHMIRSAQA